MRGKYAVFIGAIGLFVTACSPFGNGELTDNPRSFNSQAWKSLDRDSRCDMVDDLMQRIGLVGKSRAEIVAMLGEPETHDNPPDHYHLCPSSMDIWILEIR